MSKFRALLSSLIVELRCVGRAGKCPPGLEPERRLKPWFTHLGLLVGKAFWPYGKLKTAGGSCRVHLRFALDPASARRSAAGQENRYWQTQLPVFRAVAVVTFVIGPS